MFQNVSHGITKIDFYVTILKLLNKILQIRFGLNCINNATNRANRKFQIN